MARVTNIMSWPKLKTTFVCVEKIVYFTTLGLGVFFIHQGEIVQRYQRQRTNFAVYEEAIFELPNIVMYVWPPKYITFGKDYFIHYNTGQKKQETDWKTLTKGNNTSKGQTLVLNFQHLYEGSSWQKKIQNS